MSLINDYLDIQKGLNKEMQKKATGIDIIFLLFLFIFPFFTSDIIINSLIFSGLGMIYITFGVINLSSNYELTNYINT